MAKQPNREQTEKEQPKNYIVTVGEEVIVHPFTASIFCTAAEAVSTIRGFANLGKKGIKARAFKEVE